MRSVRHCKKGINRPEYRMDEIRHYILATAGHVDHGKSSLVTALSGTDPDRLPEEKSRGLTIELGFARLTLEDPESGIEYRLGIVDVPGHEDFVRNMVGGVGSVDIALLVVAADDGWMPQSEEHFEILEYMGIRHGVVVLTKTDSVPASDADAREEEIRIKLLDSRWENAPIVRTAAPQNIGIDELKTTLRNVLLQTPLPADIGKPRLLVDRAFSMSGAGTIVTGTLTGGSLSVGQTVRVEPLGRQSRIRRIQTHNENVDLSPLGARTAINLPDLAAGEEVKRGHVVTLPGTGAVTSTIDCTLGMALRLLEMERANVRPLKDGTRVRLHHASSHVAATVHLLTCRELTPGDKALAQIRTEEPVFLLTGDRFLLRDWQERLTMAGGTVLDPLASSVRLHSAERKSFLQICAADPENSGVFVDALMQRDGAHRAGELLRQSCFHADQILSRVAERLESGRLTARGDWIVWSELWEKWNESAKRAVASFHDSNPERIGLPLVELRKGLASCQCCEELQDLVIGELCQNGFELHENLIHRSGRSASLPPELEACANTIRTRLQDHLCEPPSVAELLPDDVARRTMQFLLDTGEAVQIGPELVMAADRYRQLTGRVCKHVAKNGPATVSELRSSLETTRRVMVPLLEKLDGEGVTIRVGDRRALRSQE